MFLVNAIEPMTSEKTDAASEQAVVDVVAPASTHSGNYNRKKLLITGANGFLGRHVVAEALSRGHLVRVLVRSAGDAAKHGWEANPNIEVVQGDLRRRKGLEDVVAGVDMVLHLAAAKSGDMYAQYGGTVVATENLLSAMSACDVRRIVGISSFSVYDYTRPRSFSTLDETAPVERDAFARDEYAHTKLVQERLIRDHAIKHGWSFVILRPGMIYGPGNLWSARLGVQGKKTWIRMGAWAQLPATYVENCAQAILLAAERCENEANGQILNVVDDEKPPTQRKYLSLLKKRTKPSPRVIPVAWTVMRFLAGMASLCNRVLFGGRAKLPGILVPCRLHARCKPLRYSNAKLRRILEFKPRYTLAEALDRSVSGAAAAEPMKKVSVVPKVELPNGATGLITV